MKTETKVNWSGLILFIFLIVALFIFFMMAGTYFINNLLAVYDVHYVPLSFLEGTNIIVSAAMLLLLVSLPTIWHAKRD